MNNKDKQHPATPPTAESTVNIKQGATAYLRASQLSWSVSELQKMLGAEEEMGYDAPFSTLTYAGFLDMQTTLAQNCLRFQRAIEQRDAQLAALIATEMLQITCELLKEACTWIGIGHYGTKETSERERNA